VELTQLTEDFTFKIMADPNKYRDYHFFINGKDLQDANHNLQFQIDLSKILSIWRAMPFTISFINIALISPDSLIINYLNHPLFTINKEATAQYELNNKENTK
jgi:hypothetical protein